MIVKKYSYHVVWITKFGKKFLYGSIEKMVRFSIIKKAESLKVNIEEIEIIPEHVHLFLTIKPTDSVSNIIRELKGFSSYKTRKELSLTEKYKYFWGKGYYCESIGHISEKTIKKYINNQWENYI